MRLSLLPLLGALASTVLADVKFTTPAAGAALPAGSLSITWADSGDSPALSELTSYQLFLCAGGNEDGSYIQLSTLVANGVFANGNKATATVASGLGASTTNAYFLKMISVASEGGTVTNFSPRFSLTGMTGVFPATVITGLQGVTGTAGPDTINAVSNGAAAGAAPAASAFTVPYQLQTGLTKYAPMQPVPPTKITAKSPTPLHPTSAFTIATTWLPKPSIVTTITASQTFSASSVENQASPVSNPNSNNDMAKFLKRWAD